MTLRELLERHGLGAYVGVFESQRVTLADLPQLSDEDLVQGFGMDAFMDRKRFRTAVAELGTTGADALSGVTRLGTNPPGDALGGATRLGTNPPADPLGGATRREAVSEPPARGLTVAGNRVRASAVDLAALPAGAVFDGRYTIVELLGRGGMGAVYQAVDRDTKAVVALKTLPPGDSRLFEALANEAQLSSRLSHPNLLGIRHLETRGDAPYVVMELMEEGDLEALLRARGGRLGAQEALRVLDGVLAGLAALHNAQVAHLDVKPANVLLGREGRVKLADFGISSRMRDQRAGSSGAATLEYAPPEQVRGEPCDARADVYAAGMLAHVCFAGRLPFEADDAKGIRAWHDSGARKFPGVPPALGEVLARALAVRPQDRYRSAEELRAALRGATAQRSWYLLADGVLEDLKGRIAGQVLLEGGEGTVGDAEGLLARGAAVPGWRTLAGLVQLESHPLAARRAGASVAARKATLRAGAAALTGNGDLLRELPEQAPTVEAALALAAWLGKDETLAIRRLDVALRGAETAADHLALARAFRAGLGEPARVRDTAQDAELEAETVEEYLALAAFLRWELGDRLEAQRALLAAERAAEDAEGLLALAQGQLALGGDPRDVESALKRYRAESKDSAEALIAAAQALGPLPALRAWAEKLQQSAGTDVHRLEDSRRAWEALGDAESAARTATARAASLQAQLEGLVTRLGAIGVPAGKAPELLTPAVLEALAAKVEAQEKLHRAARDLDARAKSVGLPAQAWAKPYQEAELARVRGGVEGQEKLAREAGELDKRAEAVGFKRSAWARPCQEAELSRGRAKVEAQEVLARAAAEEDRQRKALGLSGWAWTLPVTGPQLEPALADTQTWRERGAEVERLRQTCEGATGWAPPVPPLPHNDVALADLRESVQQSIAAHARMGVARQACERATGWAPRMPGGAPLEAEAKFTEAVDAHLALHARAGAAQAQWRNVTGTVAETLRPPYKEREIEGLEGRVAEQQVLRARMEEVAAGLQDAPELPPGPWTEQHALAYQSRVYVLRAQDQRFRGCARWFFGVVFAVVAVALAGAVWAGMRWRDQQTKLEVEIGRLHATMVRIEPGTFMMGSPVTERGRDKDEAEHEVTLTRAFLIGSTEVTQGLWTAVMGSNPSHFLACGGDCPVESVSWCDAVVFANELSELEGRTPAYVLPRGMKQGLEGKVCNSMASEVAWDRDAAGYRLPTEEEWEYAARAGTRTLYAGGNNLDEVAWYGTFAREGGNSGDATHPVGRKRANAWGLYDMSGNVGEWAWDVHDTGSMRILRGGNFLFDGRVAKRGCDYPGTRGEYAGLRLVRNAD